MGRRTGENCLRGMLQGGLTMVPFPQWKAMRHRTRRLRSARLRSLKVSRSRLKFHGEKKAATNVHPRTLEVRALGFLRERGSNGPEASPEEPRARSTRPPRRKQHAGAGPAPGRGAPAGEGSG